MNVTESKDARLIYRYRIDIPANARRGRVTVKEVEEWADKMGIECVVGPGYAYFMKYEDITLFMLQWS